jgi:uncharacterized protein YjcR
MKPHGDRLKDYLEGHGIKQVVAAQKLEVHVNTLRNWMTLETFKHETITRVVSTFPAIYSAFEDVTFIGLDGKHFRQCISDNGQSEQEEARYVALLHKYNQLLEQHVALQQKILEPNT